jgi:hypothetical protein
MDFVNCSSPDVVVVAAVSDFPPFVSPAHSPLPEAVSLIARLHQKKPFPSQITLRSHSRGRQNPTTCTSLLRHYRGIIVCQ